MARRYRKIEPTAAAVRQNVASESNCNPSQCWPPGTHSYTWRLFFEVMELTSPKMPARTNDLLVLASIPCYDDTRGKFASGLPDRKLGGWRGKVSCYFRTCAQAAMIWQLKLGA